MSKTLPRLYARVLLGAALLAVILLAVLIRIPPAPAKSASPAEQNAAVPALPASDPMFQGSIPYFRDPIVPGSTISGYFDHNSAGGMVTFYDGRRNNPGSGFYFNCSNPAMYDWVGCTDSVSGEAACQNSRELWYDNHHGTDYEYSPNWHTGAYCDPGRFTGITMTVNAPAPGRVFMAGYDPNRPANGWHIRLQHDLNGNGNYVDDNFRSIYLHFTAYQLYVSPGEIVAEGQPLGLGGSTGYSSSPHLHFEVQRSADYFQSTYWPVDPYGWQGSGSDPYPYSNVNLFRPNVVYTDFMNMPYISNPPPQCFGCGEMLLNPGFEEGHAAWVEPEVQVITRTGDPGLSVTPNTGEWLAWLAGRDSASDTIYQEFTVPFGLTGARLRYALMIASTDLDAPHDYLYVRLRLPDGTVLQEFEAFDNTFTQKDQWVIREYPLIDLRPYQGQPIRISFKGATDLALPTSFYLDDISLLTTGP